MPAPNYNPTWRTVVAVLLVPLGVCFAGAALLDHAPTQNATWATGALAIGALLCFGFAALFFLEDLFPAPVQGERPRKKRSP